MIMNEKIYKGKKNGMAVLIISILLYAAAIAGIILSGIALDEGTSVLGGIGMGISVLYFCIGCSSL